MARATTTRGRLRATTKPAPTAKYIHTRAEACLDLRTTPLGSSRGLDAIHHFFTADEPEFCRQSLEYGYGGC